jgi:nucleoside-triphosphatase THEP1
MERISKSLAAVVFHETDKINSVVQNFAAALAEQGFKLGGILQISQNTPDCSCKETHVLDLASGQRIPILQNLGTLSQSCRVDTAALAKVSGILSHAMAQDADVIFINRFGKLEAEGKGLWAEIGEAVSLGIPTLVCVSVKFLAAWRAFSGDLAEELTCGPLELQNWWSSLPCAQKAAE